MHWRVPRGGRDWEGAKGEPNRTALLQRIADGTVHAVLAHAAGTVVGWCSFGPVESFPRLEGARSLRRDRQAGTWAIVCFYVPAGWRGHGIASRLLVAAVTECSRAGAAEIEGWPAVPGAGPVPAAFAWTGVPALFRAAGFRPIRRAAGMRPIYLRRIEPAVSAGRR